MRFVLDVDDSRHRERRQAGGAGGLHVCRRVASAGADFIRSDQIPLTPDPDRDVHLTLRTVPPEQMTDLGDLRIGHARLNLADIENE